MGIEGKLEQGLVTTSADKMINCARTGSLWPMTSTGPSFPVSGP